MPIIRLIVLITAALLLLGVIARLIRKFPGFTLRAKLLSLLLTVALVPISVLIVINNFSTQNTLKEAANSALSIVAAQSSEKIDSFIFDSITALEKEAGLDVFKSALTVSAADFQSIEDSVQQTMRVLVERNPDSLKNYALLNREGSYLTGYPPASVSPEPFLGLNQNLVNGLQIALVANLPYVSPVVLEPGTGTAAFYIAVRVNSDEGKILGLLLAVHNASIMQSIIEEGNDAAGEGSFGILLDEHHILLAHGADPKANFKSVIPLDDALVARLQAANRLPVSPAETLSIQFPSLEAGLDNSRKEPFFTVESGPGIEQKSQVATQDLESRPWLIAYIQPQEVFLNAVQQQTQFYILLGILFAAITAIGAFGVSRYFSEPITQLAAVVDQISTGDLDIQAPITTQDEIGRLASAFNAMTHQLRNLLGGLETQVSQRTRDLERRAIQIQTAAEVARDASQIQNIDTLLDHAASLISQRFGFYHVGLFLLDETGQFAVLRASNSEGGKQMIAHGHSLQVGKTGIVGETTNTGKPHISLDVKKDTAHFAHDYLPETRSEMALPFIVAGKIIGALDVQSKKADAFDQDDINILQVLADQLAIAIQNSQLLTQVQETVRELQASYGDYTRRTWREWLERSDMDGYQLQGNQVVPITDSPLEVKKSWETQTPIAVTTNGTSTLAVPIRLRGNTLGVIHLKFKSPHVPEEVSSLVDDLSDRLALALDNARLFEATQQRAAQEQLISAITSRMRETLDVNTVLTTAVKEIREALALHDIAVQLEIPEIT